MIFDEIKGGFFARALLMATYGGASGKKWTFVADSPDSGLVYPHKVGLASHIRNGNFGEVWRGSALRIS